MNKAQKIQRRWMASILKTSTETLPDMPFRRGQRGVTAAVSAAPAPRLLRRA